MSSAAGAFVLGGQQRRGQQVAELLREREQIQPPQGWGGAAAQGGELGAEWGEQGWANR